MWGPLCGANSQIIAPDSTLNNGLVAAWNLSDLTDPVGGFDLTNVNSATFVTGRVNNAVQLVNASNQYLSHADHADLRHGNRDWCWALDFYPDTMADYRFLIQKEDGFNNLEFALILEAGTPRYATAVVRDGGSTTVGQATSAVSLSTSTWYSCIVWLDASVGTYGTLYISVNGETPVGAALTAAAGTTDRPLEIGVQDYVGSKNHWWDGKIDRILRYNRVLTASERAEYEAAEKEYPF